ncbi:MAG: hypothetical protein PVF70_13630 [Anaerolineales bacterium]
MRLRNWDYASAGSYFLTICTHHRLPLFGRIVDDQMVANAFGRIVDEEWSRSTEIRNELALDAYVIMPNHMHGIVILRRVDDPSGGKTHRPRVGAHGRAPLHRQPRSLGSFVAGFKARVTKRINQHRHTPGAPVWQRGYHDHILRHQRDLDRTRRYIRQNPLKWSLDQYHVDS